MSGWRFVGLFAYYVLLGSACSPLRRSVRHSTILDIARLDIGESIVLPVALRGARRRRKECALEP